MTAVATPGVRTTPTGGDRRPVLELQQLTVGYPHRGGATVVLEGVDAVVRAGEFIGLVGPNGAGKSTLLRSIAGLQACLGGAALLNGTPISAMSRKLVARNLSMVLTDRPDIGRLRVRDVVALGRHPHSGLTGRMSARDHRIIDSSLTSVGAAELAATDVSRLSDGQRQRVMVARALAQEPEVMLLDEPTAFLDPPGRIALLRLLRRVCTERRIAVIVCTHDIETVLRYADTLWVAGPGTGVTIGGPEDLALSGMLQRAFVTPGIAFDPITLTFRADDCDAPAAAVIGEGDAAGLARHALIRSGFRVVVGDDAERAEVRVVCSDGAWTIQPGGRRFTSLAALHDTLARQELA